MAEQLVFSAAYWEMPEFWEIKAIFQISSDLYSLSEYVSIFNFFISLYIGARQSRTSSSKFCTACKS